MRTVRRILSALLLFSSATCAGAADEPARELFAVYTVVPKDTANAKQYRYPGAVDGGDHSGFYRGPAIITEIHIAKVQRDYVEMAAAPFPALAFHFTDAGIALLRKDLKQENPEKLLVVIDGHAYATVRPPMVQSVVDGNGPLFIVFPRAPNAPIHHLLQLLLEKLQTRLQRK